MLDGVRESIRLDRAVQAAKEDGMQIALVRMSTYSQHGKRLFIAGRKGGGSVIEVDGARFEFDGSGTFLPQSEDDSTDPADFGSGELVTDFDPDTTQEEVRQPGQFAEQRKPKGRRKK